jgi:flap endonuclease-1
VKLKGKRLAIDGSNALFQILNNPGQRHQAPTGLYVDRTQRLITHLYGWLARITQYYAHDIFPLVVFDGKPDPLKRVVTKNVTHDFLVTRDQYKRALARGDREQARAIALGKEFMWLNCVHESKALLHGLGVPVVEAPGEAEAQCVRLVQRGFADYVVTQDYDAILYGCPAVLRDLQFGARRYAGGRWTRLSPSAKWIDLPKHLTRYRLTQLQLIDLSILVGNDYFPGVPGFGAKRALEWLQGGGTVESALVSVTSGTPPTRSHLMDVRRQFLFPVVLDVPPEMIWRAPNSTAVFDLMCRDHTANMDTVARRLETLTNRFLSLARRAARYAPAPSR